MIIVMIKATPDMSGGGSGRGGEGGGGLRATPISSFAQNQISFRLLPSPVTMFILIKIL